jgi:single-strand DNA-binding protein
MELFGRLTANATVNEIKDGRKVINFSIAINDGYKPKGTEVFKKITTFVNCSY